jgi:hypothetical protein
MSTSPDSWLSWLSGLVMFSAAEGVQVGDGNSQRNEFVYTVAPAASARTLLAGNRRLAKALVDCACPAPGGSDHTQLDRILRDILISLPVNPMDGIDRSRHYDCPAMGQT